MPYNFVKFVKYTNNSQTYVAVKQWSMIDLYPDSNPAGNKY